MRLLTVFFGLTLLSTGISALADQCPPPYPTDSGFSTRMIYDCFQGPGWMRITWINNWGKKGTKDIDTGSEAACEAQKEKLLQYRPSISKPSLIAACTAYKWQVRFQLDEYGNYTPLASRDYKSVEDCLKDAEILMKN